MITRSLVAATIAVGMLATMLPASAQDPCADLWYRRNAIYKNAGYCFKTARAIQTFGNAGCAYDNEWELPLSGADRAAVQRIIRQERAMGCR